MHVDRHVNDYNDDNDNDDDIFLFLTDCKKVRINSTSINSQQKKICYCKFHPHKMLMNECLFI